MPPLRPAAVAGRPVAALRAAAPILATIGLAIGATACGGGPDIVDATPERQPTLTIPGGAGAGALGDRAPAQTTPEGQPSPDATSPGGEPGSDPAAPGQEEPGAPPEDGATDQGAAEGAGEFGDFCEQNPGVQGC